MEHYEKVPRIVRFLQRWTPFFNAGIDSPQIEATFAHKIVDLQMGCGYLLARDDNHNAYAWGDNYAGQLGTGDDVHRDDPTLIKSLAGHDIIQSSLGFQHCMFLTAEGLAFGMGKNNRFQMGKYQNWDT